MKKNFNMIFAAAAAFAMVLSCSKEENPSQGTQGAGSADSLTPLTISATLPEDMTKVSFTPSYDGGKPQSLSLAWEAEDKLRVYNHDDRTQYADFDVVPGSVGQKTGYFTGDIFAATSYDVEVINGEVGYAEQTQPADGQTASLKYLASATGVTDLKAVVFTESSSVLAITALMPEGGAAGVTSVELSASEAIFSTGKTLTINLAQKGDAGDDGILHLFATLPVGDQQIAEGTTLFVRFNAPDTDHTVYTRYVELGAQTFEAGKLNTINVNASQSDKHAGLVSCDGSTAEKAYLIADKYQLNAMSGLVSADATSHISMIADVDFGGSAWTSVSGKVAFEGNNHKISNVVAAGGLFASLSGSVQNVAFDKVTITKDSNNGGLLADITDAATTIKKIIVTESSILGKDDVGGLVGKLYGTVEESVIGCDATGYSRIGGLAGTMVSGSLNGNIVSGNVTSKYQTVGGLVGQMEGGSIETCSASGDVTHDYSAQWSNAGGFVGYMAGGTISSSHATGNVTVKVKGSGAGGFIGQLATSTTLTDNYYEGTITGPANTNNAGGFVGHIGTSKYTIKMDKCHSAGTMTISAGNIGGLVGQTQTSGMLTLSDCYSTVAVSATGTAGGLIGRSYGNTTATGCYASGDVTSTGGYVGGLVGEFLKGSVAGCYATGLVTAGDKNSGGLIGYCENATIEECYAEGGVSSTGQHSGGLIGSIKNSTITECYATGSISTINHYAGGLVSSSEGTVEISKSYASMDINSTTNRKGGFISNVSGKCTVSDSYVAGTITGSGSYNGGFVGTIIDGATLNVTNSYTKSTVVGGTWNSGVFCGEFLGSAASNCSHFIGWNVSNRRIWTRLASGDAGSVPDNNYMGTEGTISAKAKEFEWDETIWDLSGDDPKLKWTLASNN